MIDLEHERLEVALMHAVTDGCVVCFDSLPVLLLQIPAHIRIAASRAFDAYRPFDAGAGFFVAHIRLDEAFDGRWGWARCLTPQVGYFLLISCGHDRYAKARQIIRDAFTPPQARDAVRGER